MDTKLKRISFHWSVKTVAFIIIVLCFSFCSCSGTYILVKSNGFKALFQKNYMQSDGPIKAQSYYYEIMRFIELKDEEYIKSDEYWDKYHAHKYNSNQYDSDEDFAQMRQNEINNTIGEFRSIRDYLKSVDGLYYYAKWDGIVVTNCEMTSRDEFMRYTYHDLMDDESTLTNIPVKRNYNNTTYERQLLRADGSIIYTAFDDEYIAAHDADFAQDRAYLTDNLKIVGIVFAAGLLAFIYLLFAIGRKANDALTYVPVVDRLWTEVAALALFLVLLAYTSIGIMLLSEYLEIIPDFFFLWVAVSMVFCSLSLMLFFSLIRKIKQKTFIKQSFTALVCRNAAMLFKTLFSFTPLNLKIIGSVLAAEFVTLVAMLFLYFGNKHIFIFIFFAALASTAGILFFIIKYVIKPYDDEVRVRLDASLQAAIKAERLKTDLITNVSHDLKTPLTAILNYSELMMDRDKEDEYAKVVHEKSIKLKTLTEDLFDISKAQSGNISVNKEQLNVAEFIDQMLTEVGENVVDFKTSIENVAIQADGRLMNRVFENLIGNINKYAMPGSRAYIDAFEKDGKTHIVFKNMSNYQMNFDASEMTERFSRGDTSRTTDGNGLGLAIAQSYTEVCGGTLTVDIDGDLFKVTLVF